MEPEPEVIVIGCGPGGSSASIVLAKAGRRVRVFEQENLPRVHVGESLLPYDRSLFEGMGVWPALAGELEGGWRLRWHLELLHLLVRLQVRFGLVPRMWPSALRLMGWLRRLSLAAGGRWRLLVVAGLVGCATPPPGPSDPGPGDWTVRQGQAVWCPRREGPELAGDLVLSTRPSGDFLVEFSKTPLTLVSAHRVGARWEVSFPTEGRRIRGRGAGNDRLLWLRLPDALAGKPVPAPLRFAIPGPEGWKMENPRTGERIEGFLSP